MDANAELREGLDSVLSFLTSDCASKEGYLSLCEVTKPHVYPTQRMPAPLGMCTGCGCDAEADAAGAPRLHPQLAVLLCDKCLIRDTREFDVDVCYATALLRITIWALQLS